MKKISHEVKIGITALITIVVFIWLFNFLRGKNLFSSTANYYVIYDKVSGLAESSPVEVNGYKVGVVQSIKFLDSKSGRLLVTLNVRKDFSLPVNTVAEITTATLIAGMKVQLVYGNGSGFYSSGDTIPGRLAESIITRVENELLPLKEKISGLLTSIDSVIVSLNDVMDPQFRKDLKSGVADLSKTAKGISESELKETLLNVNKFTGALAENSAKMTSTFNSLESIADTLAAADIYSSINNLKSSLEKASSLLDNINEGKGTAGQLMTNDSLYHNLSNSLESLNKLLIDFKANPKRYVHFSVFGRKNVAAQ
ncbi:MAG TPA: MlaD family protein [Bacteroidales bacterium]|jgi:phospholipid/cholesterol/gamma-HCH transport system substrate-binding protein|nr:MlaD family protein [Bacteroidales bacterium]